MRLEYSCLCGKHKLQVHTDNTMDSLTQPDRFVLKCYNCGLTTGSAETPELIISWWNAACSTFLRGIEQVKRSEDKF